MNCDKCTGALPAAAMSRRSILSRFGMGLGGMALANLVNPSSVLRTMAIVRQAEIEVGEVRAPSAHLDQSSPSNVATTIL